MLCVLPISYLSPAPLRPERLQTGVLASQSPKAHLGGKIRKENIGNATPDQINPGWHYAIGYDDSDDHEDDEEADDDDDDDDEEEEEDDDNDDVSCWTCLPLTLCNPSISGNMPTSSSKDTTRPRKRSKVCRASSFRWNSQILLFISHKYPDQTKKL